MDGERFDRFARLLASGTTRRRIFGALAGTAAALAGESAEAGARCRSNGHNCSKDDQCCSGYCPHRRRGRAVCTTCKSGIVCGAICCPGNALPGCTEINGPNGPIVGCLCPEGTFYDRERNVCGCPETCEHDDDCCSGKCCQGVCCAPGQDRCCGGVCASKDAGDCICPAGTSCGGKCTCRSYGQSVSTGDTCCPYPQSSFCCADSYPGAGDGIAGCCTRGVDCPEDGRCPTGVPACDSTLIGCCDPIDQYPECGPDGDCCFNDFHADDSTTGELTCILSGKPCLREWPCCNGACAGETCP